MSELKAFDIIVAEEGYCEGIVKYRRAVYDKSEADKVIAEKDKEIARLNDKALQYKVLDKEHCRDLNTQERRFALQIAHHKYKRCLAMAEMCDADACYQEMYIMDDKKATWFFNWEYKWRKLSEKFKEAK